MGMLVALRSADDRSLVDRCIGRDPQAQREFIRRHGRHVHATLYRILGSNLEMEDLVQEALLEIFRSLGGYRGTASLSTWLDRITVRVAYGHLGPQRPRA